MDRMAPTRRPSGRAAGTQQWRELGFFHWSVPPELVRPLVPPSLEIDTFQGNTFVGLVPFAMRRIRPWWCPRGFGLNFLEANLRTYVHHGGKDPGVYFFSLEASSWLAVLVARNVWGLPYFDAAMASSRQGEEIGYYSRRPQGDGALELRYRVDSEIGVSQPGTLEHFLLERYLLYVDRGEQLYRGQVFHSPYPAFRAELLELSQTLTAAAGLELTGLPDLAHFSTGVDVEVFALTRV